MGCCNFAASKLSDMWHWHCGVDVLNPQLSDWTHLQWALHIAQLVAHKAGESILCVKGGYAALQKLLWWH